MTDQMRFVKNGDKVSEVAVRPVASTHPDAAVFLLMIRFMQRPVCNLIPLCLSLVKLSSRSVFQPFRGYSGKLTLL